MNDRRYEEITLEIYVSSDNAGGDVVRHTLKAKDELATISIEPSSFITYVELPNDGEPRANHFHEEKIEPLYLAKGKIKLIIRKARDTRTTPEKIIIQSGDMATISPGYAHAHITLEE